MIKTDIDIDVADRNAALDGLRHVPAVEVHQGMRHRHHCGGSFQDIPVDPLDGMAVWEHHDAEARGYTKLDIIHNTIYDEVRDEMHLVDLLTTEPRWELFADEAVVNTEPRWELFAVEAVVGKLAHIRDYFDVVQ